MSEKNKVLLKLTDENKDNLLIEQNDNEKEVNLVIERTSAADMFVDDSYLFFLSLEAENELCYFLMKRLQDRLLNATIDRDIGILDSDIVVGPFTKQLVSLMKAFMKHRENVNDS